MKPELLLVLAGLLLVVIEVAVRILPVGLLSLLLLVSAVGLHHVRHYRGRHQVNRLL